ncbi:putative NBD/HSP70 family sugar kinase [Aminobacter aganoensis]|uniref:Putative NBD/HSP70 family sugar kinase n=2 Tax=Aminobacter aganoensis TaxID=83264 RepID=A0A7X0FC91_9HYPH|nr:putative NBD/HSP70 family sugar kinase [Aminobacter aganoensis]
MVISAVRRASQPSRTEIAATTGLSHSTISTISSDLIAEGILAEAKGFEPAAMKRGRPQVALALEPRAASIVAVVLSLNSLSAAVIDYAGNTMAEDTRRLVTQRMPAEALVSECIAMIRRLIDGADTSAGPVLRIAIAVQGITDSGSRKLLWSPITRHDDIPFADRLEQEFGVPVTVENDCNMIAEALRWRDPLRYRDDFIAILLSHGIGMGLVIKGELFTGTQSSGAEFGHMIHRPDGALCRCGRRGCIEAYAGNYAIWRNARLGDENAEPLADLSDDDITALADAARDHDGPEREAFRKAGEAIGFGLGSMFALFDPAPLAFVGVGATAFDLMEPHVLSAIAKTAGGLHSKAISFDTEPNEVPLKREGAMMRALLHVDQEIFAAGPASRQPATDVA